MPSYLFRVVRCRSARLLNRADAGDAGVEQSCGTGTPSTLHQIHPSMPNFIPYYAPPRGRTHYDITLYTSGFRFNAGWIEEEQLLVCNMVDHTNSHSPSR